MRDVEYALYNEVAWSTEIATGVHFFTKNTEKDLVAEMQPYRNNPDGFEEMLKSKMGYSD